MRNTTLRRAQKMEEQMSAIDTSAIRDILADAHSEGRTSLYEHECYRLLEATGAEAAPPTAATLDTAAMLTSNLSSRAPTMIKRK